MGHLEDEEEALGQSLDLLTAAFDAAIASDGIITSEAFNPQLAAAFNAMLDIFSSCADLAAKAPEYQSTSADDLLMDALDVIQLVLAPTTSADDTQHVALDLLMQHEAWKRSMTMLLLPVHATTTKSSSFNNDDDDDDDLYSSSALDVQIAALTTLNTMLGSCGGEAVAGLVMAATWCELWPVLFAKLRHAGTSDGDDDGDANRAQHILLLCACTLCSLLFADPALAVELRQDGELMASLIALLEREDVAPQVKCQLVNMLGHLVHTEEEFGATLVAFPRLFPVLTMQISASWENTEDMHAFLYLHHAAQDADMSVQELLLMQDGEDCSYDANNIVAAEAEYELQTNVLTCLLSFAEDERNAAAMVDESNYSNAPAAFSLLCFVDELADKMSTDGDIAELRTEFMLQQTVGLVHALVEAACALHSSRHHLSPAFKTARLFPSLVCQLRSASNRPPSSTATQATVAQIMQTMLLLVEKCDNKPGLIVNNQALLGVLNNALLQQEQMRTRLLACEMLHALAADRSDYVTRMLIAAGVLSSVVQCLVELPRAASTEDGDELESMVREVLATMPLARVAGDDECELIAWELLSSASPPGGGPAQEEEDEEEEAVLMVAQVASGEDLSRMMRDILITGVSTGAALDVEDIHAMRVELRAGLPVAVVADEEGDELEILLWGLLAHCVRFVDDDGGGGHLHAPPHELMQRALCSLLPPHPDLLRVAALKALYHATANIKRGRKLAMWFEHLIPSLIQLLPLFSSSGDTRIVYAMAVLHNLVSNPATGKELLMDASFCRLVTFAVMNFGRTWAVPSSSSSSLCAAVDDLRGNYPALILHCLTRTPNNARRVRALYPTLSSGLLAELHRLSSGGDDDDDDDAATVNALLQVLSNLARIDEFAVEMIDSAEAQAAVLGRLVQLMDVPETAAASAHLIYLLSSAPANRQALRKSTRLVQTIDIRRRRRNVDQRQTAADEGKYAMLAHVNLFGSEAATPLLEHEEILTRVFDLFAIALGNHDGGWRLNEPMLAFRHLCVVDSNRDMVRARFGDGFFITMLSAMHRVVTQKSTTNFPIVQAAVENALEILCLFASSIVDDWARAWMQNCANWFERQLEELVVTPRAIAAMRRLMASLRYHLRPIRPRTTTTTANNNNNNNNGKPSFLISFHLDDSARAWDITGLLRHSEHRVWIDEQRMLRGEESCHGAADSLVSAIEHTDVVIVLLSTSYRESGYRRLETWFAHQRRCKIIPIVVLTAAAAAAATPPQEQSWLGPLSGTEVYVNTGACKTEADIKAAMKEIVGKMMEAVDGSPPPPQQAAGHARVTGTPLSPHLI